MLYPDMNLQKRTQQNTTRYRTALYLRLSREDGDKTESDSIANQRKLLEAYAIDHPELCIVDEFVDDGYSGSNFERPAFQRLFQELEQGTINCILVKDLSRFGRNYIEVGRYLERIFPVMRVRLIAVTDNYDSQSAWKTSDSIMVPMRNLLNDAYCRDISVKIKSQLAVKRKRGDFVGSFATYGYQKDPSNHSKLIVDELAAENVQSIFCWKISGMSNQGIADRLNAKKVQSPCLSLHQFSDIDLVVQNAVHRLGRPQRLIAFAEMQAQLCTALQLSCSRGRHLFRIQSVCDALIIHATDLPAENILHCFRCQFVHDQLGIIGRERQGDWTIAPKRK